jgi:hypothetical protein
MRSGLLMLLPNLEKTVNELVLELLLTASENRHPDLLYSRNETKNALRISMHYVLALLAYGFTLEDPELQTALKYFDKSFPRGQNTHITPNEMNRLLVLLHLAPDKDCVETRLRQLVRQQSNGYFDIQPGWQSFDMLWALKVLVLAKQKDVLPDSIISREKLQQHLDRILNRHEMKHDKDLALALRLQYDLNGSLKPAHEVLMEEMNDFAHRHQGMWGMREFEWRMEEMHWYQYMVEGRTLTYEMVKDNASDKEENSYRLFRKIILSTCMVIEYMSPLTPHYPHLQSTLAKALSIWWGQLKGPNPLTTLRGLFPKGNDYEYLLVIARTLRAVRAQVGKPLRQLDPVYLLRDLAAIKRNPSESREQRNLKQALRNWVYIDIVGAVEQLKLGFSEANVVRVQPYINSPTLTEDEQQGSWINHSLVVKYGPKEDITKERENYKKLPGQIRDYFVKIPDTEYIEPETGVTYVVMQDLKNYRTLYEVYTAVAQQANEVGDQLSNFLCRMHEGGTSHVRTAPRTLLREMYLGKMLEHIDRVFSFVYDNHLFDSQEVMRQIQYQLFDCLGRVIQQQQKLEVFPAACMHGDLHLRNIMVKGLENSEGKSNLDITFKLIDLEFFHTDGDAAFDAGELMIDIDLVSHDGEKMEQHQEMMRLCEIIKARYNVYRDQRKDEMFDTRVELAKARALLRIAKGKAKRGQRYIETGQQSHAHNIAEELVTHASAALGYLENVVKQVG